MSFSSSVIVTKKGLVAPEAFIRMSLAKNKSMVTIAYANNGELTIDGIENPSFDDVMAAQELVKQYDAVMQMSTFDKGLPEDSAQPFAAMEEGDAVHGLLYLDGDFSNYGEPKSTHSEAFFANLKYFKPKLDKWFKKGGLENVKEELADVDTKMDVQNSFIGRGNVIILLSSGEIFHIQKGNQDFAQYPWGYVTNSYGYKEQEKQQTSVPQVSGGGSTKLNALSRRLKVTRTTDAAPAPKIDPQEGTPAKDASKSDKAAAPAPAAAKKEETKQGTAEVKSPEAGTGEPLIEVEWKPTILLGQNHRADKKAAYDAWPFIGEWRAKSKKHYPEGYKKGGPIVMRIPSSRISEFLAAGAVPRTKMAEQLAKQQQLPRQKVEENRANKDVAPKHVQAKEDSNKHGYQPFEGDAVGKFSDAGKEVKFPQIAEKVYKAVEAKQFVDVASQVIGFDPKTIQGVENQIANATEEAGTDIETILRLSTPALLDLNRSNPVWFTDLFVQVRHMMIKNMPKEQRPQPSEVTNTNAPPASAKQSIKDRLRRKAA